MDMDEQAKFWVLFRRYAREIRFMLAQGYLPCKLPLSEV